MSMYALVPDIYDLVAILDCRRKLLAISNSTGYEPGYCYHINPILPISI